MNCRHCSEKLIHVFLDLGFAPPSNSYLSIESLNEPEITFPLKLYVCERCWLVQTQDYAQPEVFFSEDYAYFSSISKTWLEHSYEYTLMIIHLLDLSSDSFVIEIASNDGYLLKNFLAKNIPCLGIEPTTSTADVAEGIGIPVLREFFNSSLAKDLSKAGKQANLICGNNVYAHVPDINDFTLGLSILLKPSGTITLEFPHLLRLIEQNQFDTVYHEHFSYLSLTTVSNIFARSELRIYNVEELKTHGGSLRIYGCHINDPRQTNISVRNLLETERVFGLKDIQVYLNFQNKANNIKNNFVEFLISQKKLGKSVSAYGAAAKGSTLLNYSGVKGDLIDFIFDAAPSKQNRYMPGSHIPILHPNKLPLLRPDWIIVLPWNIADEIISQVNIKSWGGRFVIAVPQLKVIL